MNWPEGHVTVLFTDIQGSTQMSRAVGDEVYREVLRAPHNRVIREEASRTGGFEVGTPAGDSFMLVFETCDQALDCALGIQRRLQEHPLVAVRDSRPWTVRVRIGIHTSEVPLHRSEGGEYVSSEVSVAARVETLATGGQVLLSTSARRACTAADLGWQRWPNRRLRGVDRLETLYEPLWDGASRGEPGADGRPLHERARSLWEAGRWTEARDRLEEALEVMRRNADRRGEGVALANLGVLLLKTRDFEAARQRLEEALEIAGELGDRQLEARTRGNLALAWRGQGRYEPAERELRTALRLRQDLGDGAGSARFLLWLGTLHREAGFPQRAARDLAECREQASRNNLPEIEGEALHEAGLAALAEGNPDRAETLLQKALGLAVPRGDGKAEGRLLASLARVARGLEDPMRAERHLHTAVEKLQEAGDEEGAARALISLGALRLEGGDTRGARTLLEGALERAGKLGDPVGSALARADLALVERGEGHMIKAWRLAEEAAAGLQAAGQAPRAEEVRAWMREWAPETVAR